MSWRCPTLPGVSLPQVPSTLRCLTAVFGMGTGVTISLEAPELWAFESSTSYPKGMCAFLWARLVLKWNSEFECSSMKNRGLKRNVLATVRWVSNVGSDNEMRQILNSNKNIFVLQWREEHAGLIRTARLKPLRVFHLPPINQIISLESHNET